MKRTIYRIAFIYSDFLVDDTEFQTTEYFDAYVRAGKEMKKDVLIQSCLIYNSKGKSIAIKRRTVIANLEVKNLI